MLDLLRKHASSWLIKSILALIILTFILFFGYSGFYNKYLLSQNRAAVVEDRAIPKVKFDTYYQQSLQQMEKQMSGENAQLPEEFRNILKKNVLNQLVIQEVVALYGEKLGLSVSDEALAQTITSDKRFAPDGNFDVSAYEKNFLPFYEHRYGENFETDLRRQLVAEKLNSWTMVFFGPWRDELNLDFKAHQSVKLDENFESTSPFALFGLWIDSFREKIKINVNQSLSSL